MKNLFYFALGFLFVTVLMVAPYVNAGTFYWSETWRCQYLTWENTGDQYVYTGTFPHPPVILSHSNTYSGYYYNNSGTWSATGRWYDVKQALSRNYKWNESEHKYNSLAYTRGHNIYPTQADEYYGSFPGESEGEGGSDEYVENEIMTEAECGEMNPPPPCQDEYETAESICGGSEFVIAINLDPAVCEFGCDCDASGGTSREDAVIDCGGEDMLKSWDAYECSYSCNDTPCQEQSESLDAECGSNSWFWSDEENCVGQCSECDDMLATCIDYCGGSSGIASFSCSEGEGGVNDSPCICTDYIEPPTTPNEDNIPIPELTDGELETLVVSKTEVERSDGTRSVTWTTTYTNDNDNHEIETETTVEYDNDDNEIERTTTTTDNPVEDDEPDIDNMPGFETIEESGIDFQPLKDVQQEMFGKVPFSTLTSFSNSIAGLVVSPQCPSWTLGLGVTNPTLSFCGLNSLAEGWRFVVAWLFRIGTLWAIVRLWRDI